MKSSRTALTVATVSATALAIFVLPLTDWVRVVRLPALLVPCGLLLVLIHGAPRSLLFAAERWVPSRQALFYGFSAAAVLLLWYVLTRYEAGEINAIDFTVYFDRPAFQTMHGRLLFIESADDPGRAYRSLLAIHAYWIMIPLSLFYALSPTPLWLLAVSAIAVVAGAFHIMRIMRHLDATWLLSCGAALALIFNANTATALNYGFHPEILYVWSIPCAIDMGLRRRKIGFGLAVLATLAIKEDALMILVAIVAAIWLTRTRTLSRRDGYWYVLMPVVLGVADLAVFYRVVVPFFNRDGGIIYTTYWTNYGQTPLQAFGAMLTRPLNLLRDVFVSGFFRRVLVPHLFLPLLGWRWIAGIIPIVVVYAASNNEQLTDFGIYYSIVLVPFLVLGSAWGAVWLYRRRGVDGLRAQTFAALTITLGAVIVGSTSSGYSLRPWRSELQAVRGVLGDLSSEQIILVQSAAYAHAGYGSRIRLLTPEALADPANAGAAVLLSSRVSAYPFSSATVDALASLPQISDMPQNLRAVRLPSKWTDSR